MREDVLRCGIIIILWDGDGMMMMMQLEES
jgi:hypothetical protein